MTETWSVVKFIDDCTVAAVPSKWITNNFCLWPPYSAEKLNLAIKSQKMDTCWPSHKVEVFRNATYDSYETARRKAKKAEDTSDLSTDEGNGRIRKSRNVYSPVSSGSDDNDYVNPKGHTYKQNEKPTMPTLVQGTQDQRRENEENLSTNEIVTSLQPKNKVVNDFESTPSKHSNTNANTKKCQCYCPDHGKLKCVYYLRSVNNEVMAEIKALKISDDCNTLPETSVFDAFKVPLTTEEELLDFKEFLKNPENYTKVEQQLRKWGGTNLIDFIRRCMGNLIANQLAVEYSWLGRRTKKNFSNFELAKVLISAALKAKKCTEAHQAEQEIARWLRRAQERLKAFRK